MAADALDGVAAPELLVVGSISADRITVASGETRERPGGAGLYAALGAAATGARPGIAGIVSDDVPEAVIARLSGRVDTSGLLRIPGQRLRFDITYDTDSRAHYRVDDAAAEALMTPDLVLCRCPGLRAAHLCPTGAAGTQADLAAAVRAGPGGGGVFLSATTFRNRILAEPAHVNRLVEMLDVLVCSAEDACLLAGTAELGAALRALIPAAQRPRLVCVTDGRQGAYVLRQGQPPGAVRARRARLADPTGAGESFAGALAARLAAGCDPVAAASTAARVAAITVTGWGPDSLFAADAAMTGRDGGQGVSRLGWRG